MKRRRRLLQRLTAGVESGCVASDVGGFGRRVVAGGWIWSVSGGAVGAEGACGWWLVAAGVGSGVGRGVGTAQ